jgi:general secretion pathway protein G
MDPGIRGYNSDAYLPKVPHDPWGNPYLYICPGQNAEYEIISLGKDGEPGGTGDNADIQSWNLDEF